MTQMLSQQGLVVILAERINPRVSRFQTQNLNKRQGE